jgi:hypothetical protein
MQYMCYSMLEMVFYIVHLWGILKMCIYVTNKMNQRVFIIFNI